MVIAPMNGSTENPWLLSWQRSATANSNGASSPVLTVRAVWRWRPARPRNQTRSGGTGTAPVSTPASRAHPVLGPDKRSHRFYRSRRRPHRAAASGELGRYRDRFPDSPPLRKETSTGHCGRSSSRRSALNASNGAASSWSIVRPGARTGAPAWSLRFPVRPSACGQPALDSAGAEACFPMAPRCST